MGAAFGKVVTAFAEKMFAPAVGLLLGGHQPGRQKMGTQSCRRRRTRSSHCRELSITASIDFLVVAFVMFLVPSKKGSMPPKRKQWQQHQPLLLAQQTSSCWQKSGIC